MKSCELIAGGLADDAEQGASLHSVYDLQGGVDSVM